MNFNKVFNEFSLNGNQNTHSGMQQPVICKLHYIKGVLMHILYASYIYLSKCGLIDNLGQTNSFNLQKGNVIYMVVYLCIIFECRKFT